MINLPEVIQEMLSYKESLRFWRKTYENYLSDFNKYFSNYSQDHAIYFYR